MKTPKLPRKRKKAFIKASNVGDYVAQQIIGVILRDPKFPKRYKTHCGHIRVVEWW